MADLYSSLTDSVSQPNPSEQWVYASDQYAIYEVAPSAVPDTRAKWDRVGHTIMNGINPDYVMMRSADGVILMVVGNSRWDAASLKQTMDRECFQDTAGDVTYTVTASTGYFAGRDDNADGITNDGDEEYIIVDENFSYWRDKSDVMITDDDIVYYMEISRTNANNPNNTDANWNDETGEKTLIAAADKATNYNLGNYFTGRYNEFPLDLAITNGSNLRMYHFDLDEINNGDGTDETTSITSGVTSEPGAPTENIYDRNGFFSQFIGAFNPLIYTWQRKHDIADGVADDGVNRTNRLVAFIEQDKFAAGGAMGLARLIGRAGGDLEDDGIENENDAGMIVTPVAFTATP